MAQATQTTVTRTTVGGVEPQAPTTPSPTTEELQKQICALVWVVRQHARSEFHSVLDAICPASGNPPPPSAVAQAMPGLPQHGLTQPSQSDIDAAPPPGTRSSPS